MRTKQPTSAAGGSAGFVRLSYSFLLAAVLAMAGSASAAGKEEIRVALYRGAGTGGQGPTNLMKLLNVPAKYSIREVTPELMQAGTLTNYDVVIFAGGSASKQAATLGEAGREAVRQFVSSGGGYIGICAGAYLATSKYPWSLRIIDAGTVSPKWQRGRGDVKMEITREAGGILPKRDGQCDVLYANGPIVQPAGEEDLPDYKTLAVFRTELARNGTPEGIMIDSPAIFASDYKAGRVICISPHPEQTPGLEGIVLGAVSWVAKARQSL